MFKDSLLHSDILCCNILLVFDFNPTNSINTTRRLIVI